MIIKFTIGRLLVWLSLILFLYFIFINPILQYMNMHDVLSFPIYVFKFFTCQPLPEIPNVQNKDVHQPSIIIGLAITMALILTSILAIVLTFCRLFELTEIKEDIQEDE